MKSLYGPEENRRFIDNGFMELTKILPCSQSHAIQHLHFKLGHSTDYVRTELVYTFVEERLVSKRDDMLVSLTQAGKQYLKELERRAANSEQDDDSLSNEKESRSRKESFFAKSKTQKDDGELPTDERGNHIHPEAKAKKKQRENKQKSETPETDSPRTVGYCRECDTDYGSEKLLKEHVKLSHHADGTTKTNSKQASAEL